MEKIRDNETGREATIVRTITEASQPTRNGAHLENHLEQLMQEEKCAKRSFTCKSVLGMDKNATL